MKVETAAQIIPERDATPGADPGKAEPGIAAIASAIAAGSSGDVAADHLAADVVLRAGPAGF